MPTRRHRRHGPGWPVAAALAALGFIALGSWQIARRADKLELIARVQQRLQAPAVAAPGPAQWARIGAEDAYRRVRAAGHWQPDSTTRVQAVTDLGAGWWVLTPLAQADGSIVWVNRGFVAADARIAVASPPDAVEVGGLLRLSEPGGAFLRRNDPATNRWYSRDVAGLSKARKLSGVAPYFIDADAVGNLPDGPIGGLTVVTFANNHLVYAATWYALAAMAAWAAWRFGRSG